MRHIIQIILISAIFYSCTAQKKGSPKIYAYRQAVLQGVRPERVSDVNGKEVEQVVKAQANFFIYIETPDSSLQVKTVWIRQEAFKASATRISTTPVVMGSTIIPKGDSDTLVNATSNSVFQVQLDATVDTVIVSNDIRQKISGNELVVHCIIKGKDHYQAVPVIKNLHPVALQ